MASRFKTRPSMAGNGLLERMRSTTFALLGVTAAMGLGLVALASQQGWPYLPALPIPAAPAEHGAVHDARALTPSPISTGSSELRGGAPAAGSGGVRGSEGAATPVRVSSDLSGSHPLGAPAASPPAPGAGQPPGAGAVEPAPTGQPAGETPAAVPTPAAAPAPAPTPASPSPAPVAAASPPPSVSSSSEGDGDGKVGSSSDGKDGGSSGWRDRGHRHWSHPPAPTPQPPAETPAPVPTEPAPPAVKSPGDPGGDHGYSGHDRGYGYGHYGR